ncbi:Formimidoyltetrahydrofolate cyclodeaminase [Anaerobranca californiensis DSM 14826]|jgi:formiminotetrahydrofolate cyclodeaminase|uniref:Formimidoyltetrahydrofolate cyclodeaminase n=1 Tax=Anaerobranca californiensis DSM 14826 TaxID=1120989 RepID=A0A1M6L9C5_9FIRM|nr:cyclodeaminase/cyclohydrolase family protein [Anaerobranca californiensis]SHJ67765.1 Formimidoyltetrahydrofolate cyclodeaminase [Anaerobranca californiensis DSM 14826]
MFKNLTVEKFLQEVASENPTPGGGTVAALSGAMGASLISMFCRVTAKGKKYVDVKGEMEKAGEEGDKIREKLLKLADEDTKAYLEVMQAFKLPKDSEEEKEKRREAIELASQRATEVPLETAKAIVPLLEMVVNLAPKGNTNAISDLKVGMELCYTGFVGAVANVQINLATLKDQSFKREIEEKLQKVRERAEQAIGEGRKTIASLIS